VGPLSGLTLFLPHGYEGQGPEHSSARLERFLQLCAEYNIQVCVPVDPRADVPHVAPANGARAAQTSHHHDARRACCVIRCRCPGSKNWRPAISATSSMKSTTSSPSAVTRVVLCSGKVYFDLLKARRESKIDKVAIVRIEQLYPFPSDEYEAVIRKYSNAREIVWCQEEPQNQGSWYQIRHRLQLPLWAERRTAVRRPRRRRGARHRHRCAARTTTEKSGHRGPAGTPPEEASRQTMRLPAAQTRTG
jgi:2-oxoglutarate dehydrogenase E1 component